MYSIYSIFSCIKSIVIFCTSLMLYIAAKNDVRRKFDCVRGLFIPGRGSVRGTLFPVVFGPGGNVVRSPVAQVAKSLRDAAAARA